MLTRFLVVAGFTVFVTAGTAVAQPDFKAAAEHYKSAEAAMARADFSSAALEYGVAYDITKDPILFFKIGQANERAGKCPVALTYYNRYVKEGNPNEEYKVLVAERIAACTPGDHGAGDHGAGDHGAGDHGAGDHGAGDHGAGDHGGDIAVPIGDDVIGDGGPNGEVGPSFIDQRGSWKRTGAWISTGLTVGLVAAGAVLALSAEGSEEDIQALIDFRNGGRPVRYNEVKSQYDSLAADGKRFDQLATAAFIGAGATTAIAVTLFLLDRGGTQHDSVPAMAHVRPTFDRHGGGVAVGWEF
jgi:hypothetical protein